MKKLLAVLLIAVLCLGVFLVSCGDGTNGPADTTKPGGDVTPTPTLDGAKAFLINFYGKDANPTNSDYTLSGSLTFQGTTFTVEWTVDVEAVKLIKNDDGSYTVDVDEKSPEEVVYYLTATIKNAAGESITATLKRVVPAYRELSHADFVAAKDGDAVVIQGVVTGIVETSKENDLYLEDEDGGYFVYSLDKKPSEMGIKIGMTVKVAGTRGTHYGVNQVVDASVEIIDSTIKTVTPTDITDIFNAATDTKDATLLAKQSMLVTIKGVTILGQDTGNTTYYNFSLNGKTTYVRISTSTSMIDSNAIKTFESIVSGGIGQTADVTGIVTIYNNAMYLVPVTAEAFHDLKVVERTPAEQVEFEKGFIKVDALINESGAIELPATGNTYKDVTVTWAVTGGDFAKIEGGKLIVSLPEKETKITLTATLKNGDATATATFEVTVAAAPTKIPSIVNGIPEAGKPYKFYLKQVTNKTNLYLAGGMNGFYLATTQDVAEAVDVYVELVPGKTDEYYIYYLDGETKNYIKIAEGWNDTSKKYVANVGISKGSVSENTYKFNAEINTFVTTITVNGEEKTYYIGTYSNYSTFSASETYRVTGNNASAVGDTQFVAQFATMVDVTEISDEDKIKAEKNALSIPENVTFDSSVTLPLFGATYNNVTISWTSDNACAVVAGDKLTFTLGDTAQTVKITATIKSGDKTEKVEFTVNVAAKPLNDPLAPVKPEAGKSYNFVMLQGNLDNTPYFLKGGMDGYYMATSTNAADAIVVFVEETTGGYYLATTVNGAKKYINMVVSGTHVNGAYEDTATTVYTYDETNKTFVSTVNDAVYAFGTRNDKTYTTMGPVKVEMTPFLGYFIATEGTPAPEQPEIPDSEVIYIEGDMAPEYLTFEEALAYASIATQDVVIKIRKDVNLNAAASFTGAVSITIEGIPASGKNPVITTGNFKNKFVLSGNKTYTFKNIDIVNEYNLGCLIQVFGSGIAIEGCNFTSADQYCMINLMATDGSTQTVTIKNSTLTHTAAAANNAIITTGNAATSTTEPSWAHWMNAVISIENSTLVAKETAIWVSAGSTAQITVNGSTITGGEKDVIVIANPNFLKGESAEIGKTSLTVEDTTITPAEGKKDIAYDETCENITVTIVEDEPETPDTPDTPDVPAEGGKADLETLAPVDSTKTETSYTDRTTDAGWKATGARSDEQACFGDAPQIILNGKTSALGTLISPVLTGGIKSFSVSYGYAFSETNGVSIKINVKNAAGEIVATTDLIDTDVTKEVGESFTWTLETAVEGDFVIEIINNSPTNADSNKDRVSLWNIAWVSAGSSEGGDEPETPSNEIKVNTVNSYGFNYMAEPPVIDSFTATEAGYYTFNIPAGLGLWSKAAMDANPYGGPEVEFMDNYAGETYTVELAAGEVFEFYVGATTEEEWVITWSFSTDAPAEEEEIWLEEGDNTVSVTDTVAGTTTHLSVYESATYTFTVEGAAILVYNSYGMPLAQGIGTVQVDLEASYMGYYTVVIGSDNAGDYTVNVAISKPAVLEDGENTVNVTADGITFNYYAENAGNYTFTVGAGVTVVVTDSFGTVVEPVNGQYALDSYSMYKITLTAATAGDYTVTVGAPIFLSTYEETTVKVDGTTTVFFMTDSNGKYTLSGEGLTFVITDAEGNVVENGSALESYTTYTVKVTAAAAGEYSIAITFEAEVGSYDNPEKIESFPATVKPTLDSAYATYYYEFTATATGHITVTFNGAVVVTVGTIESEAGATTLTVPVVAGKTYPVCFYSDEPAEVEATLTFAAGALTEAEWKAIILYSSTELEDGSEISIIQDYDTEEDRVLHSLMDNETWEWIYQVYYSYTVTANEDGTLTITLTPVGETGTATVIAALTATLGEDGWILSVVETPEEDEDETKPLTELKDGDIVIITAPAYNMAFSAEKTGHYNVGKVASGGLGDNEKFKVTVNADGSYTFTSLSGKVIAMADSYNSLNDTGANKSWTLEAKAGAEGIFYLKNTVRGNYLEWYDSYSNWSTYTTSSPDDKFELSFYKVG